MKAKVSVPGHSGELDVSEKELNALQSFFSFITPSFIKDSVGILGDNAAFARWKNTIRIITEAEEFRQKHNLETYPLPLKATVEYLEAASLEEDPAIQTMWANLLANMTSVEEDAHTIFVSILRDIRPNEARILQYFYTGMRLRKVNFPEEFTVVEHLLADENSLKNPEFEIVCNNLERLRLIEHPLNYPGPPNYVGTDKIKHIKGHFDKEYRKVNDTRAEYHLTRLGYTLVKACNEPTKFENEQN